RSIIQKRFDKTPYELINKRKPNIKFFRVFGCRCYLFNDYKDVGKLKAKGDIRLFVGYSKESAAFRIYNKQTRKIHESMNVNFDEILEIASKQISLEPGLSNLNETGKSLNRSVSKVDEASKNDLEDLFQYFSDEYFDSSKIMKSSTTNVETPINKEVFHESKTAFASNMPIYLLHMDLCGPMCIQSINGKRYVLVVVDDYSWYTWVFFLHSKDEASEVIISFIKKTQVTLQLQVQRVRTDNGTEFKNKTLAKFFDEVGISQQFSAARTPQQNGVVERRNRTLVEAIHESVNVNFNEISEMASKQFSLELGLSKLNKTRKSSSLSVSQVSEASRKDLEDLFHNFYDEYFDSSKIMKSSTTKVETLINEEDFHEVSESFQGKFSSSSLNDDVQQSPEDVILPQTNTQSISNNMISNDDEASTSQNVFNEQLEDAYFDASTSFHDPSIFIHIMNLTHMRRSGLWIIHFIK
nr:hypothetical protein [Tanacetum cinerariifolium]